LKIWKSLVEENKLLKSENEDACSPAKGKKKNRSRQKKKQSGVDNSIGEHSASDAGVDEKKLNTAKLCGLTYGAAGAQDQVMQVGAAGAQVQVMQVGAAGAQVQVMQVGAAVVVDDEDKDCCCVCLDAPKQFVFGPCGHLCVCETCANEVMETAKECPMCRTPALTAFKVWK
jgi:hypothetical protein